MAILLLHVSEGKTTEEERQSGEESVKRINGRQRIVEQREQTEKAFVVNIREERH